jgi:hypothetical protein
VAVSTFTHPARITIEALPSAAAKIRLCATPKEPVGNGRRWVRAMRASA